MSSQVRDQRAMDLLAADHLPVCPRCDNVCPPGATVCECGGKLLLQPVPKVAHPAGCDCNWCRLARLAGELNDA